MVAAALFDDLVDGQVLQAGICGQEVTMTCFTNSRRAGDDDIGLTSSHCLFLLCAGGVGRLWPRDFWTASSATLRNADPFPTKRQKAERGAVSGTLGAETVLTWTPGLPAANFNPGTVGGIEATPESSRLHSCGLLAYKNEASSHDY